MRILIIGGAGFIGTNLCHYFRSHGYDVSIFDSFTRNGTTHNAAWMGQQYPDVRYIQGDIRVDHKHRLANEIASADAVFHLAAQVTVTTSITNPREDFEHNCLGTFNVLEAVRRSPNHPLLIYTSTNKVYGHLEDVAVVDRGKRYAYRDLPEGISEHRGLDFHSPYGCSKGAADQYVRDYARIYGLRTVVFRQSCIYGPHQFGVEDQGWVAWFTIAAILGLPLTIYGDGKQVRDVLHVDDLARAFEMALVRSTPGVGHIYNIGGGPAYTLSLLELLTNLEQRLHKKIPLTFSSWRAGDQPVYVSDIRHARSELGWKPRIDPVMGIDSLFQWTMAHRQLLESMFRDKLPAIQHKFQ